MISYNVKLIPNLTIVSFIVVYHFEYSETIYTEKLLLCAKLYKAIASKGKRNLYRIQRSCLQRAVSQNGFWKKT